MEERHRRRTEDQDWWGRLPGWARAASAIAAIWIAGWTSALVAQKYQGVPDVLADHESRIEALERAKTAAQDRANRTFMYVACRLDEIANDDIRDSGFVSRCSLVLDEETRDLLRSLRSPR